MNTHEMKLGLKIFIIVAVILSLLVPLGLIKQISSERKERAIQTQEEIIQLNGGRPSLIGPLLIVPVTVMVMDDKYHLVETTKLAILLSDQLDISGNFTTETRNRGIYKAPVFSGNVHIAADFSHAKESLESLLGTGQYTIDWKNAWYAVDFNDKRSLKSTPMISVNGKHSIAMTGCESALGWGGSAVRAKAIPSTEPTHVDITFEMGGGGSLKVFPFGKNVNCTITSDWKSPSFTGYIIPTKYDINNSGFNAFWTIPASAQPYPESFIAEETQTDFDAASFSVEFFQSVSIYHKTERAIKYALVFIIVPFVVFFLFEIFLKKRIHPLQYTLIGIADVLFYLILLSLAEHIPFVSSYAMGALAVCLLVAFYSGSILNSWKRGLVIVPVLGGIYVYLYIALESEDFALLVGTLGVFLMVATFMFLTRNINWYSLSFADTKPED